MLKNLLLKAQKSGYFKFNTLPWLSQVMGYFLKNLDLFPK
jgi:hypothetical protein